MQIFLINGDPSRGRVFQKRNRFVLARLDFDLPLPRPLASTYRPRTIREHGQIAQIPEISRAFSPPSISSHELFPTLFCCVKPNRLNDRRYYRRVRSPENGEEAETFFPENCQLIYRKSRR